MKFQFLFGFSGQIEVYKDQVRQFSKTIVQLEKNLTDEQEKYMKIKAELDNTDKKRKGIVFISIEKSNEKLRTQ